MRRITNGVVLLTGLVVCATMTGCASLEDRKYEIGQHIRTSQAWGEYDHCSDEHFTGDYRRGWEAGYYDVLTGGDGCPPLVAPQRYWKPPVICDDCDAGRQDWYVGFQDGAACARTVPDSHYLKLWTPSSTPVYSTVSSGSTLTTDTPALVPPAPDHPEVVPSKSAADVSEGTGDLFPLPLVNESASDSSIEPAAVPQKAPATENPAASQRPYEETPPTKNEAGEPSDETPDPAPVPSESKPAAPAEVPPVSVEPSPTTLLDFLSDEPEASDWASPTSLLDFLSSDPEASNSESPTAGELLHLLRERNLPSQKVEGMEGKASVPRVSGTDGEASLLPETDTGSGDTRLDSSVLRRLVSKGDPWLTAID